MNNSFKKRALKVCTCESDWKYSGISFKRAYNITFTVGTFFKIS